MIEEAEMKARLMIDLEALCRKVPSSVANGTINITRQWLKDQKSNIKLSKNSRAKLTDLECAVRTMRSYL